MARAFGGGRLPAIARARLRGGADSPPRELDSPGPTGGPCLANGLPLDVGVAVDFAYFGPRAASPRWCAGVISHVVPTHIIVQYGEVLLPPGTVPTPQSTEAILLEDVPTQIRLRRSRSGTGSPSRAACCQPYVEDAEIESYRSSPNSATRRIRRRAAEDRALARARTHFVLPAGVLEAQLAALNNCFDSTAYIVECYSGPFRSISSAAQQFADRVATVTVDHNARFSPDVLADLRYWSLWRWMLSTPACAAPDDEFHLPGLIHFSPSCTTFCRARDYHGRTTAYPGGFPDSVSGVAATQCMFSAAFLLEQVHHHGLHVLYLFENPQRSRAFNLPFMEDLAARSTQLEVTYCLFGSGLRKATLFLAHPDMEFSWATLISEPGEWPRRYRYQCPLSPSDPAFGCCGATVPSVPVDATRRGAQAAPTWAHTGRDCAFSIADSEIPLLLGGLLIRSYVTARAAGDLRDPGRTRISRRLVCQLAAEWELGPVQRPWRPIVDDAQYYSHREASVSPLTSDSSSVGAPLSPEGDQGSGAPISPAEPAGSALLACSPSSDGVDDVAPPAPQSGAVAVTRATRARRACAICGSSISGGCFHVFALGARAVVCRRCREAGVG